MFLAGVPTVDIGLADDPKLYPTLDETGYPTYHTGFETIRMMESQVSFRNRHLEIWRVNK